MVFLGPSLSIDEASKIIDADFRPPVKRGDMANLGKDVRTVGMIDGVFHQNCSVGHREIVAALKKGTRVIGGGSMGALRASELSIFGMEGVGEIFALYSKGDVEGDDEVALTFDPETFIACSEPLVNIRIFLNEAVEHGIVDSDKAKDVLEELKSTYYPRRSLSLLLNIVNRVLNNSEFEKFSNYFEESYRDVKREDAIKVLKTLENMR